MAEIDEIERLAFESDAQLFHGLVWDLAQELMQYSDLMHQFGGRGMNRIASEVPEELAVLLHQNRLHARPREQVGGASYRPDRHRLPGTWSAESRGLPWGSLTFVVRRGVGAA